MTILGKIFVFFNLILASFMMFGVATLWFNVKSWKKEAERLQKVADDNKQGADIERKKLQDEKERTDLAISRYLSENDRYRVILEQTELQIKQLKETLDTKLANEKNSLPGTESLQKSIEAKQAQLDTITTRLRETEESYNSLIIQSQLAYLQMNDAIRERNSFSAQAERLRDQLKDLSDRYADLLQGNRSLQGPVAPENFRGTVRVYKDGFVEITPGLNSGLRPGTKLTIRRNSEGKFVGYLVIGETINPDRAVGKWVKPTNLKKVNPDDEPKVGDEVVPATN